jgi:hypothetical protein
MVLVFYFSLVVGDLLFGSWQKKIPGPTSKGPGMPFFILGYNSHSPQIREGYASGLFWSRSSGFRISLLAAPSHPFGQWIHYGFRPRLRRRVRDGISPSSLSRSKNHSKDFFSGIIDE